MSFIVPPIITAVDHSAYTVRANEELADHTIHSSQNLQQTNRHQLNAYYQAA